MSSHVLPPNPNIGLAYDADKLKTVYFAGGCFWGTEAFLSRLAGVADTACGYANGTAESPNYEQVCTNLTGHAETVLVRYDPERLPLEALVHEYFKTINPTKATNPAASQYRSGIYFTQPGDEGVIFNAVRTEQANHDKPVQVEVLPLVCFYRAEEYHQRYLEKNPDGFCHVDFGLLPQSLGLSGNN